MSEWPCVTCPHREGGICGALLGKPNQESRVVGQPGWQRFQTARAHENIVIQNDASDYIFILCSGWAFRFLRLADLPKQILHFLLPGEIFSSVAVFEERYHFSVQALTDVQVSRFARAEVRRALASNPCIVEELGRSCGVKQRYADELMTMLGRGSAEKRIAYLFLHLMRRLADQAVIRSHRFNFPLRQQHVAEVTGLTPVHVSRVIKTFRDRGLIELAGGSLAILDLAELERIGSLK